MNEKISKRKGEEQSNNTKSNKKEEGERGDRHGNAEGDIVVLPLATRCQHLSEAGNTPFGELPAYSVFQDRGQFSPGSKELLYFQ